MVQDRTNVQSKVINGEVGAWVEMMPTGLGNLRRQVLADDPNSEFLPCGRAEPPKLLEEGRSSSTSRATPSPHWFGRGHHHFL